jgi:hypothetical protein
VDMSAKNWYLLKKRERALKWLYAIFILPIRIWWRDWLTHITVNLDETIDSYQNKSWQNYWQNLELINAWLKYNTGINMCECKNALERSVKILEDKKGNIIGMLSDSLQERYPSPIYSPWQHICP